MLDFYEAGSGEKYALVFTEESPIPSVVQNGRLFVVKFNANWLQIWAREIKGAGSASFEFSKIETDAAGSIYCFFFDGAYHINCIHPDGNLIWSRSISSGIQANGLSGTIIGDFELDPAGQDLIVAIFATLARETYFLRFNRSDGNLSASARLKEHLLSDILPMPGNQTLAVCQVDGNYANRRFMLLDSNFTVVRSWEYTDARFFLHQLVSGRDSTFFVFADGFLNSCIYRMDYRGNLLGGIRLNGLDDFGTKTRGLSILQGRGVALPAALAPDSPRNTALLLLDETFVLDACIPLPFCAQIKPASLSTQPLNPSFSSAALLDSDLNVFWQNTAVKAAPYCLEDPFLNGVTADFSIPDTICTGEEFSVDGLVNGGATAWFWSLPGANPDSSNARTPGLLKYGEAGTYSLRQITISECLTDTFEKNLTVLSAPLVALPPALTVCADTILALNPLLENATDWYWQDQFPDLIRVVDTTGIYILTATNQGYCFASDTTEWRFIRLNTFLDIPPAICSDDRFILIPSPNPPGTALRWNIDPVLSGLVRQGDTLFVERPGPDTYTLQLRLENNGCVAGIDAELNVVEAPRIELGPDFRLKNDRPVFLKPSVFPLQSASNWLDGYPTLEREIGQPGTYVLQATLGSCTAVDTLVVFPPFRIYQPNVFRPGSSQNGFFTVFTGAEDWVENLFIYDRWGGLVFQGPGLPGWDGRLPNGRLAGSGVFAYRAVIRMAEGAIEEISGDVTITH